MSKFRVMDFKVETEPKKISEIKVNAIESPQTPQVKSFELADLKRVSDVDYSSVKSKYGPLAATDQERMQRGQKDRRFSLDPLLRDPLSVEQEEQRVMETKINAQIQSLAERAKESASAVGYQDGLKKGFDEAFKKFQSEGQVRLEKFGQLIAEVEHAKNEIFTANEKFLIDLIYRISRMVLLRELSVDRDYLLRLAKELILKVGAKDNVTLRVNSDDAETIGMLKAGIEKAFGQLANLTVESSSQVKRGGCQIETEWSAIDASIETQLDGIHESLFGKKLGDGP